MQTKLHIGNKIFENTIYNDILGIGIPELLMNIISCHVILNKKMSAVIFSCVRKFIGFYPSKGFIIFVNSSGALRSLPLYAKQIINA